MIIKKLSILVVTILSLNGSSLTFAKHILQPIKTNELALLNQNIHTTENKLAQYYQKQQSSIVQLASIEKKISSSVKQRDQIQNHILQLEEQIKQTEQDIEAQKKQLNQRQQHLAQLIANRYKIRQPHLIKWLLKNKRKTNITHLLHLYQYIAHHHVLLLTNIRTLQICLEQKNLQLKQNKISQNKLQKKLAWQDQQLQKEKQRQQSLNDLLEQNIITEKVKLKKYESDKERLKKLLSQLTYNNTRRRQTSFASMRHQLPYPLPNSDLIQKNNQGLIFFAAEGTPVHAVSAGRVVFSDWLNGYGLLLILDHGQGFMSLYAHNQALFKTKGMWVASEELIARVGHSGGNKDNALYFELRQQGKSLPPLEWLHA